MSEKKTEIAFKILVYSGALRFLEYGLCYALYRSLKTIYFNGEVAHTMSSPTGMEEYFPEIYKYKPSSHICFWFPRGDKEPRIKILESEIEKLFDKL